MCIIMITKWTLMCWFFQCLDGLFFKIIVPLGSIPELPATSCQEINKNEGKKLDSGKYSMSLSGKNDHVYCNMSTVPEGKFNPCTSIIIIYNEYHTCNTSWGTKFLGPQPYKRSSVTNTTSSPQKTSFSEHLLRTIECRNLAALHDARKKYIQSSTEKKCHNLQVDFVVRKMFRITSHLNNVYLLGRNDHFLHVMSRSCRTMSWPHIMMSWPGYNWP